MEVWPHDDTSVRDLPGDGSEHEIDNNEGVNVTRPDAEAISGAHTPGEQAKTRDDAQLSFAKTPENKTRHKELETLAPEDIDGEEVSPQSQVNATEMASALKDESQTLDQNVRAKSRDHGAAKGEIKIYNERLTGLRRNIELLTNAVKTTIRISARKAPDTKTLQELRWDADDSLEIHELHQSFVQLTERLGNRVQTLSDQNTDYQRVLAEKEIELAKTNKELKAARELKQAPGPSSDMEADHKTCRRIYSIERQRRMEAEHKFIDFKRRNRELQVDLNDAHDQNTQLKERAQTLRTRAQRWEGEYKTIKSRAEKESAGLEHTLKQQHDEMIRCVKEYRDKVKDQGHWEVASLREKVEALERHQKVFNEAFDQLKREKARMEDTAIPQLQDTIKANEEEIRKLDDA